MSYDVSLTISTGKEHKTVVDCGNYTSNVGGMYREVFPRKSGIHFIHGKTAGFVIQELKWAVATLESYPERFKEMNPENGWGSYEGAIAYLKGILSACEENPLCTVHLSA